MCFGSYFRSQLCRLGKGNLISFSSGKLCPSLCVFPKAVSIRDSSHWELGLQSNASHRTGLAAQKPTKITRKANAWQGETRFVSSASNACIAGAEALATLQAHVQGETCTSTQGNPLRLRLRVELSFYVGRCNPICFDLASTFGFSGQVSGSLANAWPFQILPSRNRFSFSDRIFRGPEWRLTHQWRWQWPDLTRPDR